MPGRPAAAGRAVVAAAGGGAGARADRSGAELPAAAVPPEALPSTRGGTRLPPTGPAAAVPGRLLGLAGRPGLAAGAGGACCCERDSLRGDHLPPPPALPPHLRLPMLPSTCSGGCCCCWGGAHEACSSGTPAAAAAPAAAGACKSGAAWGSALLMLRRPSLPPLTLPLVMPLPAAVCPCEPWLRSGAWDGRGAVLVAGFQLLGALSAADLRRHGAAVGGDRAFAFFRDAVWTLPSDRPAARVAAAPGLGWRGPCTRQMHRARSLTGAPRPAWRHAAGRRAPRAPAPALPCAAARRPPAVRGRWATWDSRCTDGSGADCAH